MSKAQTHEALRLMSEFPTRVDVHGPKSEALVARAERHLGLAFPPSFREFLLCYGQVDFAGNEYYGLLREDDDFSPRAAAVPNVVAVTDQMRREDGLADNFVAIYNTGYGPRFLIDTSRRDAAGESPVVEWFLNGEIGKQVAPDFGSFLLREVEGRIDYMDEDELAERVLPPEEQT